MTKDTEALILILRKDDVGEKCSERAEDAKEKRRDEDARLVANPGRGRMVGGLCVSGHAEGL